MAPTTVVTVLGAGYSGLTTASELTVRGFKVNVVAYDLGKLTHSQEFTILNSEFSQFFFTKLMQVLPFFDCLKQSTYYLGNS